MMFPAPLFMVLTFSQHIRFARASSQLADSNARNRSLTAKCLQQGFRYHKLRIAFLNFIVDTLNWFLNILPD